MGIFESFFIDSESRIFFLILSIHFSSIRNLTTNIPYAKEQEKMKKKNDKTNQITILKAAVDRRDEGEDEKKEDK